MIDNKIPCGTCGKPSPFDEGGEHTRCTNCWEVEKRLEDYLKSPGGMAFVRQMLPTLDDWVDGKPDAWDYEAVLSENHVTVEWDDKVVDSEGTISQAPPGLCGWAFSWKHGAIYIGQTTETIARKAAALFVELWKRGVSASFCDKLMDGFIVYLERQENKSLTFLAEIESGWITGNKHFRVTRAGLCRQACLISETQDKIIAALGPVAEDEEIIVTFTKRKK